MSNPDDYRHFPATPLSTPPPAASALDCLRQFPAVGTDLRVPLLNLSTLRNRLDSVQQFLCHSVNSNTLIGEDQMRMVSAEISAAIHQVIVNGAALISSSQNPQIVTQSEKVASKPSETLDSKIPSTVLKVEAVEEEIINDWDIVELDSVELLAEHLHFCEICGKGFKRDANLRMHMRAHGNQFKTPEALAKPEKSPVEVTATRRMTRFSCPYAGCNRNKMHKKFRPLKSVICVKNHFKRSHCPKMFSCNRCNKKSFSVVADLKSHLKHCGETKWKCSCGTSFSRKDKLFGHMALFEGHMPAVMEDESDNAKGKEVPLVEDEDDEDNKVVKRSESGENKISMDDGLFEDFLEGFGSIENFCLQDMLGSPKGGLGSGMDWMS